MIVSNCSFLLKIIINSSCNYGKAKSIQHLTPQALKTLKSMWAAANWHGIQTTTSCFAISGPFRLHNPAHTKTMSLMVRRDDIHRADLKMRYVLMRLIALSTWMRTDAIRRVSVTSDSDSWDFPERKKKSKTGLLRLLKVLQNMPLNSFPTCKSCQPWANHTLSTNHHQFNAAMQCTSV